TDGFPGGTFRAHGVTTLGSDTNRAYSVIIQVDGKLVAGGFGPLDDYMLERFNINGSPDSTFGTFGVVKTPIDSPSSIHSLAIQTDEKIVASGYSYIGANGNLTLARYNPNGFLDSTFNND